MIDWCCLGKFPAWVRAAALGALLPAVLALGCGETVTRPDGPPTITAVTPALGPVTGGTTVTIVGTGLGDVIHVAIGGGELAYFAVRSDTLITGLLGGAPDTGAVDVVVISRTQGAGRCTACFVYYDPALAIIAVSPDTAAVGSAVPVTIEGTGFVAVTSVTIGGVELLDPTITPTRITGTVPADSTPGVRDVAVTSDPAGRRTCAGCFTYQLEIVLHRMAAGGQHTCALSASETAYCWGENGQGQLGDGSNTDRTAPVAVASDLRFRAIVAGEYHTCGLTPSGAAYCWGYAPLGDGSEIRSSNTPVQVTGGLAFSILAPGTDGYFTCGLTRSGTVYCWGDNLSGQLGVGRSGGWVLSPRPVFSDLVFQAIAAGDHHACALTVTGTAHCWGRNRVGQVGDGTTIDRDLPVPVSGDIGFALITGGESHTCALGTGGAAYCWGNPPNVSSADEPVSLFAPTRFTTLEAGGYHVCGIDTTGTSYCWGSNSAGQLGDGTLTSSRTLVEVSGNLGFSRLSVGRFHTCGLTVAGAVYCWGANGSGQLGNGTLDMSTIPVAVLPFGASPPR